LLLNGRIVFELVLLAIVLGYGAGALDLSLNGLDGTLGGPGLFPRILAAGLIVSLLVAFVQDIRRVLENESASAAAQRHDMKGVAVQAVLLCGYVYAFTAFGVWVAAPVYIVVGMALIERPFRLMPLLWALTVSLAFLYLLDFVLHANLP
jgi:hypothetical protein